MNLFDNDNVLDPRGLAMDELERVLEGELWHLASGILGHPERPAVDRSAEADVRVGLGGHERMFA